MNTNYDIHDQEMDSVIAETNEALSSKFKSNIKIDCEINGVHMFIPSYNCGNNCINEGVK
jgi:hypothetical protein